MGTMKSHSLLAVLVAVTPFQVQAMPVEVEVP